MHPEITKQDFKSFAERYKNSDEEKEDLISFYEEMEGDISTILQCIMCSENEDLPRYIAFYEQAILSEDIERTALFTVSKGRVVTLEDETSEAKAEKKKIKKKKQAGKENKKNNDMGDLEAMILARQNKAASGFLNYMESKYCGDAEEDLPDESMFEAAASNAKKRTVKTSQKAQPKKRARKSDN